MTALRDRVVTAFETGDQLAIRRLGWWPAWEACATWWAPRQTCTAMEFVPFAKLLGGEDPEKVLDALRDLCGDWRPTPAQVRGHLHRKTGDESTVDVGRCRNPFLSDRAIAAVADALKAGEQPCCCGGFESSRFHHDGPRESPDGRSKGRPTLGVLRCRTCRGLEWGQIHAVEDLERPEAA